MATVTAASGVIPVAVIAQAAPGPTLSPTRRGVARMLIVAYQLGCVAFLSALAGCSLITLKSPERPLSTRDLNARILTRQFSADFVAAIDQCADEITAHETSPVVQLNALRWRIGSAAQSERAAAQLAPMMAVVDTWTLAAQMQMFLAAGSPGGALFGKHQDVALAVAVQYGDAAKEMAQRLIPPDDFGRYQRFVDAYIRAYPIRNLDFVRPSVVEFWARRTGVQTPLVDTLGTVPQALADASERVQMLGNAWPSQVMWRTELALQESGLSGHDVQIAMKRLDDRLAALAAAGDAAPELVHGAVNDVRRSLTDVLKRVDASSAAMIEALRNEREALSATVHTEREAVLSAADAQRKAIAQDAARIADQVVRTAGDELRHLARQVLLLLIVLAIIVLGLPFLAGYLVGRTQRRPAREQ
ncbi:MAG TPA: hypothetical protein VIY54_05465 [Steroidobacteraceae bacterium]